MFVFLFNQIKVRCKHGCAIKMFASWPWCLRFNPTTWYPGQVFSGRASNQLKFCEFGRKELKEIFVRKSCESLNKHHILQVIFLTSFKRITHLENVALLGKRYEWRRKEQLAIEKKQARTSSFKCGETKTMCFFHCNLYASNWSYRNSEETDNMP